MDKKALMKKIEQYGQAMKDFGYRNAGFLDDPRRIRAMLKSQRLEKELEDFINDNA